MNGPKGIGRELRVRDLYPGMLVALKLPGEPFRVTTVHSIHRLAVIFGERGNFSEQKIWQRSGDELDRVTLDGIIDAHMFEYTAA